MLDNLRDDDNSKPFFEDETDLASAKAAAAPEVRRSRSGGRFLGMTPVQRFIISVMLMMMVCILGAMVLLLTEKIGIYL